MAPQLPDVYDLSPLAPLSPQLDLEDVHTHSGHQGGVPVKLSVPQQTQQQRLASSATCDWSMVRVQASDWSIEEYVGRGFVSLITSNTNNHGSPGILT